ncbi:MAG TPA: phenylacetate-CoA oxygenase subunit PaaI [Anaerolineae bacterium]|nr:phenylacetate-CoA oxygenase subunit PaaI [Anaerolineae bacterium]
MDEKTKNALAEKLLAWADDELILGHRDSEWTGHAPILEEDIAFANIAQDEIGHAIVWYELRQALTGETPDEAAYWRDARAYRNAQLVELPKGDWAVSMLRQYLFDAAEAVWLPRLADSAYQPLAEAAAKMRPEEIYHLRHTAAWVRRLGLGTAESNRRMQAALDYLWRYALQLFAPLPGEAALAEAGIVPDTAALAAEWRAQVIPFLEDAGLTVPDDDTPKVTDRSQHTEHLVALLGEMQMVARLDPQAAW